MEEASMVSYYSLALSAPPEGEEVRIRVRAINPSHSERSERPSLLERIRNPRKHGRVQAVDWAMGHKSLRISNVFDPARQAPPSPDFEGQLCGAEADEAAELFKAPPRPEINRIEVLSRAYYQQFVVKIAFCQDPGEYAFAVAVEMFVGDKRVDGDLLLFERRSN